MLQAINVSLQYGSRILFKDVNLKFTKGNCYGVIGANGSGKSTFLKVLSREIEPNKGEIFISPNERMSVLTQNQNAYDEYTALKTVLLGHKRLSEIDELKNELYSKSDFTDADGLKAAELEEEFAEGDAFAVLESVKAAADVYAPLAGVVVEINEELEDDPSLVNSDPYGNGWLAVFELAEDEEISGLMDAAEYQQFAAEEE